MFEPYLSRWELVPDGEAIVTHSSRLLPVLYRGEKAMLKIAVEAEEKRGGLLMLWWDGDGAARVLEHEDDALLLERATGTRSLEAMARDGRDDEASRIICAVAARLHALRGALPSDLVPLEEWFRGLWPAAETHGGILRRAAETARSFSTRRKRSASCTAICTTATFSTSGRAAGSPSIRSGSWASAASTSSTSSATPTRPWRSRRAASRGRPASSPTPPAGPHAAAAMDVAYHGLSAAWIIGDGDDPVLELGVAALAAAELKLGCKEATG